MPQYYGTKGWKILMQQIRNNEPSLTTLDLTANGLRNEGVKSLCRVLIHNYTIAELILSHNGITADGAKSLGGALKDNRTLQILDLSVNSIGAGGIQELSLFFENNKALTMVNLSANKIGVDGARQLSLSLRKNPVVRSLNLAANELNNGGIKDISFLLKENPTITYLNLHYNNIGVDGARDLSLALEENETLMDLSLSYVNYSMKSVDDGIKYIKYISEALKKNHTLKSLDLCGNDISDIGADYLISSLLDNYAITNINLTENHKISATKLEKIKFLTQSNQQIAQTEDPIKRANLIGKKSGIWVIPRLLELSLFAVKKTKSREEIEKLNLPKELYEILSK